MIGPLLAAVLCMYKTVHTDRSKRVEEKKYEKNQPGLFRALENKRVTRVCHV